MSRWTGIPVNTLDQDEKEKLMCLADRLRERVVGQEAAVNLVAQAVLRSRAGLDQPGQPIGSFLFLGSTGVGKTELGKALAEQLFDSEKMLIRFDMNEFVDSHSVLRLIGAPPRFYTILFSQATFQLQILLHLVFLICATYDKDTFWIWIDIYVFFCLKLS